MSSELAPYNWFSGGDRVSIYEDGTLEIQHEGVAYRAPFWKWVDAAEYDNLEHGAASK